MAQAIPSQHPAVVLRSHYRLVRALLAVAMIAVLGLTSALVIVATQDEVDISAGTAQVIAPADPAGSVRYDGGPEEGTRGAIATPTAPPVGTRYDGGPEEGTRGAIASAAPEGTRYDGGPDEGSRGPGR